MKKIVISGSASLKNEMERWLDYWKSEGCDVLNYPRPIREDKFVEEYPDVHKEFYIDLVNTEILFIANEEKNGEKGYIGPAVFAEIAFVVGLNLANDKNIKIILNQMPIQTNKFYGDIKLWLDLGWVEIKTDTKNYVG